MSTYLAPISQTTLGLLSVHLFSAYLLIYLSTYLVLAFVYLFNPNITDHKKSIPTVTHLRAGTLPCRTLPGTPWTPTEAGKKGPYGNTSPRPLISHYVRKKNSPACPAGFRNIDRYLHKHQKSRGSLTTKRYSKSSGEQRTKLNTTGPSTKRCQEFLSRVLHAACHQTHTSFVSKGMLSWELGFWSICHQMNRLLYLLCYRINARCPHTSWRQCDQYGPKLQVKIG